MQKFGAGILEAMTRLIEIFSEKSKDHSTLDELNALIKDRSTWHQAHQLFLRIRRKNTEAARRNEPQLVTQYAFEEACAKTLYNLCSQPAPFDPDSPYWIVPNALATARKLGIDDGEIISAIMSK
jgi:hypothetical protein